MRPHGELNGYWWTHGGSGWPAGCQRLEVGCSLMEVAVSNTVSVSHTVTSADRLLLTHQTTTPWKASGTGVAEQRTHSWSVTTQYKISSLVTAVSTSLWLVVADAPENNTLATPQQADLAVAGGAAKEELIDHRCTGKRATSPTTRLANLRTAARGCWRDHRNASANLFVL